MDYFNLNQPIEETMYIDGNNILEISNKLSKLINNKIDSIGIFTITKIQI